MKHFRITKERPGKPHARVEINALAQSKTLHIMQGIVLPCFQELPTAHHFIHLQAPSNMGHVLSTHLEGKEMILD